MGMDKLPDDHAHIRMRGTAGQSLGAFLAKGITLEVFGDANDYVGKGLSGATITLRPHKKSKLETNNNSILGNTVLYGATSGQLYAAGQAGERFAVRNSGATTVIEGCGSNGCEYMTGGRVVILGATGDNFGAGMTGGLAYIYDIDEKFKHRVNEETLVFGTIKSDYWTNELHKLIVNHVENTNSQHGKNILEDWENEKKRFIQVCPIEIISTLEQPLEFTKNLKQVN